MQQLLIKKPEKVEHSPTLDTVLMVEQTIKEAKEVLTIGELKKRLPRQIHHYTLKYILDYLQKSGKIEFTPYGVVWIFIPKEDLSLIMKKDRTWT